MSQADSQTGIVGCFEHLDSLVEAIEAVKEAGYQDFQVFSPAPRHEIEHAIGGPKSPVRYITYSGGISGFVAAFILTIGSSFIWMMIVGGKPIASIPPFLVVVFELTILLGGLATLGAIGYFSRVPGKGSAGYDPRFSDDRFGIFVKLPLDEIEPVRELFEANHVESCWTVPRAEQGEEVTA